MRRVSMATKDEPIGAAAGRYSEAGGSKGGASSMSSLRSGYDPQARDARTADRTDGGAARTKAWPSDLWRGDPGGAHPVGSEEAPNEELASVRRTNRTYSFPVSGFHERAFAICSEGISETRLTSLNSVRNRLVGYSFHAALRHRLVRCDHSLRIIQPSS